MRRDAGLPRCSALDFGWLGERRGVLGLDTTNTGSERVAERVGYVREGVLRSYRFKEDIRRNFGIWSQLRTDR
jgi:RimJ/RimL family protein N-acetyltransferase